MCDQQSLRSACAYTQSDQNLCYSLEYSMIVKLLTDHHLEFLSLKGGCRGSSYSTLVKLLEIISCGSIIIGTYSLLDLSLECLDLALEFVNKILEPLLVLPVLVSLEGQLFKSPISLAHVLLGFSMTTLFTVKLSLEFTYLKHKWK